VDLLAGIKAYILCKVSSGAEREICNAIAEYHFVTEVSVIYGEYDVIVDLEVENMQQLDFVIDKVRMIPSVTFTSTMITGKNFKDNGKRV
jgi:DNA-binding Lrp family transcriptional regulator